MSVKWEKEEGTNNGKLTFEIEPAKIKEGLDVAFNRVKKSLNVPGFRKGKVPRQIFNKMFGEESLYQDALNAVLPEAYTNAVKESDIKPVDQPEIDVESMEKDSAWVLTAKVTVEPEVELGEYKGLEVAAQSTEVTDEDVDAELNRMREQQAELVLQKKAIRSLLILTVRLMAFLLKAARAKTILLNLAQTRSFQVSKISW